jgi:hypothetical protein
MIDRNRQMSTRRAITAALIALLATGCNGSETTASDGVTPTPEATVAVTVPATSTPPPPSEPSAEPTATASTTPSADPTTEPADADLPEPGTDPTESDGFPDTGGGDVAYLDSVEIGDHPDYERVVFTMTEDSPLPAWRVEYTDEIRQSGSGNPVDVTGEEFLQVTMSGASGVDLSGEDFEEIYTGPDRLSGEDAAASAISEVVLSGDFEATMGWGVGLEEERPFRAFALEDPARVVVDVMTN